MKQGGGEKLVKGGGVKTVFKGGGGKALVLAPLQGGTNIFVAPPHPLCP